MIAAGDLVQHPRLGSGVVLEVRNLGYDARVNFFGHPLWVPCRALTVVARGAARPGDASGSGQRPRSAGAVPTALVRPQRIDFRSRQVLESLRIGIVPDFALKEWTVGREMEFQEVRTWLDDPAEGSSILLGAYGAGKTHMLRYLEQQGLEQGFAVAMVRVDPGEENSAFPYRFYGHVMKALRVPNGNGLEDSVSTFQDAVMAGRCRSLADHPFYGRFARAVAEGLERRGDWQAFLGDRADSQFFPNLHGITTAASVTCNMLTAFSGFLAAEGGVKGLLLLVDEVETAEVRRHLYHWKRTLNFLRGLTLAANDDPVLVEQVIRGKAGFRVGATSDLVYCGHYPDLRYSFASPSHLKVMLALTDCRVKGRLREWRDSQPILALSDIRRSDLYRLFGKIAGTYCALHGIGFPSHLEQWVFTQLLTEAYASRSVRGFAKATVEVLDYLRHYPGEPLERCARVRNF
ncbi:MAG: hypothetical protein FJ109_08735 [Deltaproteobacteria bacterium]|nr:hypothetical protein [Deltaproteobacteria bacterium]